MTTASSSVASACNDIPESTDCPVQLAAYVFPDGNRFVAAVDGLDLEGKGNTPDAAQESLVQAMRSWLERLDTAGKLGDALGIDSLSEETEIVLQFHSHAGESQEIAR